MSGDEPAYLRHLRSGELEERITPAYKILSSCSLCPHCCGVDRVHDEQGYCGAGLLPVISGYGPHFGEEPALGGRSGSGTIFFSDCTMRCEFCQNYMISQSGQGREITCEELAGIMLVLQGQGCHNINLVSPTHYVPQILRALFIAAKSGLSIPLVYNTGGYDCVSTLRLLEDVIDIYMPDAKYGDDKIAKTLSHAPSYTKFMKDSVKEMQRQVGDLICTDGIARRGLIIRHPVLPDDLAGSEAVLTFIAEEISVDAYVNIMDQYRPEWHVLTDASDPLFLRLRREITHEEYEQVIALARGLGLHRGFPWI